MGKQIPAPGAAHGLQLASFLHSRALFEANGRVFCCPVFWPGAAFRLPVLDFDEYYRVLVRVVCLLAQELGKPYPIAERIAIYLFYFIDKFLF